MGEPLFSLRDARADDLPTLNAYAWAEGMDALPSAAGVRVAANADDAPVGFLRVQVEDGVAYVNPMVTYAAWRGYGVGRALMEDARRRFGELRLVSRGSSRGFYEKLGFAPASWDDIAPAVAADCDGCPMRGECGPQPMRRA